MANSPPLSAINCDGVLRPVPIHMRRILFNTTSLCLLVITDDTLNLVARSMRCKNQMFLSQCFKSIAMVSLKSLANGRLTTGPAGVLLYFKHMSHLFVMSSTNLIHSWSFIPASFKNSFKLWLVGWANCRCNFLITFSFSFLSLSSVENKTCFNQSTPQIVEEHALSKMTELKDSLTKIFNSSS